VFFFFWVQAWLMVGGWWLMVDGFGWYSDPMMVQATGIREYVYLTECAIDRWLYDDALQ
jgi:hypothetical protein